MKQLIAGSVLIAALASQADAATLTVYTDRTLWEAAAGTVSTENFNAVTEQTIPSATPTTLGALNFIYNGDAASWAPQIVTTGIGQREFVGQVFHPDNGGGTTRPGTLTFGLGSTATAWGADFKDTLDGDFLAMTVAGETVNFSTYLAGVAGDGFLGVVSDTVFSQVMFAAQNPWTSATNGEQFKMDNASFNTTVIPVPTALWLFLSGAAALARFGRRSAR